MFFRKKLWSFVFAAIAPVGVGQIAHAAFVVNLQQVGANVVGNGSGTINTAGLTPDPDFFSGFDFGQAAIGARDPFMALGPVTDTAVNVYDGISGPSNFGPGGGFTASSGSGDAVTMYFDARLYVPSGYVSGAALSDTATWANQSFNSLGVTPGTYTWTWGSGATADSFTLNAIAVPEPTSAALLTLAGLSLLSRRRHRN